MDIKDPSVNRVTVDGLLSAALPEAPVQAGRIESNDHHFQTDHLLTNLKGRTISSGFITLTSQGVQFALTMASTMILARLLEPRDFGLLAMVFTIMGFLRVFKEAGLSTATVQREGITHAQVSNLFWINVGVSGFVSMLVAAAAPLIAWFYREPRLVGITVALSVTFLLAGLAVQHMALLNRQMRFKAVAVIQIGSVLAGVLVGVGMAWRNYGYWSLVGLNLTTNAVALLLTWWASRWRPQFFTRRSGTRSLLHFGANLTAGAFFYSLARGLDGLLIGRFYGAASVGLYSRAAAMLTRPLEQIMSPIEAVFIPVFSRLQTEPERFRRKFLEIYETIALASFLFTGMFFALAHPLTLVLLGPKWENAAVIFACFSFAALAYPLGSCASWLLTSQGRGRDSLVAASIVSVIIAASFIVGLPFGPTGVALAYSVSALLLQLPIYYWLVGRKGPVRTSDLWTAFLRQLPVWGVVALVTWLVRLPIQDDQALKELLLATPASLLAGAAFIFVYPPSRRVAANLFSNLRDMRHPNQSPDSGPVDDRVNKTSPSRTAEGITPEPFGTSHHPTDKDGSEPLAGPGQMLSVIICTHNPRPDYLQRVLDALNAQTLPKRQWELLLIDNASKELLAKNWDLSWHPSARHIREEELGLTEARLRGITETENELLVFIDDDNILMPDYLERVIAIPGAYPYVGVFGAGILEPEFEVEPESTVRSRLFMLALRKVPQPLWTNHVEDWFCMPFGAGLCVPRRVAELYTELVHNLRTAKVMGRSGTTLFCGEDDLFSWLSAERHSGFGIFPELRIKHLIPAGRVQREYLVRLVYGHSFSHTILSHMFHKHNPPVAPMVRRFRLATAWVKSGWFHMRCRQAELRGDADARQYIHDHKLEPLPPGKNPLAETHGHWTDRTAILPTKL